VAPRERTKPRNGERSSSGSGAKTRLAGSGVRVQGSLGFHEEDVCGGPVTEWAEIWPMVGRKLSAHQVQNRSQSFWFLTNLGATLSSSSIYGNSTTLWPGSGSTTKTGKLSWFLVQNLNFKFWGEKMKPNDLTDLSAGFSDLSTGFHRFLFKI
jgi:hypothetical protein